MLAKIPVSSSATVAKPPRNANDSIVGRDDEFGFANVEDKLPELEKVLGKENVSVRIVDGLGHGFGIGNETKVKNWLQEAVIFWEAHR